MGGRDGVFSAGGPCASLRPVVNRTEERPLPALRSSKSGPSATASGQASVDGSGRSSRKTAGQTTPNLVALVVARLDDDKAENILSIDLAGKSSIADAMIIASGRSQRHVTALADHVARALKDAHVDGVRVEGLPNADWVLIDAGDLIVHLFRPEVREFYNLERIWAADAPPAQASVQRPV